MTVTPTQTDPQNILATMRQLAPQGRTGEREALQIAKTQAEHLRHILNVHGPRFPHEALMDIPVDCGKSASQTPNPSRAFQATQVWGIIAAQL